MVYRLLAGVAGFGVAAAEGGVALILISCARRCYRII